MKWFKNLFNKVTDEDGQEMYDRNTYEEAEEDFSYETYEEQQREEQPKTSKGNFRFPLIDDVVTDSSTHSNEVNQLIEQPAVESKPLRLNRGTTPVSSKEHYSPFTAPGNSQHVAHGMSREHYNPFKKSSTPTTKVEIKDEPVVKPQLNKTPVPIEPAVQPKKRFVPSDVPSPVFGFKKPSTLTPYERKVQERLQAERKKNRGTLADQLVQNRVRREERLEASRMSVPTTPKPTEQKSESLTIKKHDEILVTLPKLESKVHEQPKTIQIDEVAKVTTTNEAVEIISPSEQVVEEVEVALLVQEKETIELATAEVQELVTEQVSEREEVEELVQEQELEREEVEELVQEQELEREEVEELVQEQEPEREEVKELVQEQVSEREEVQELVTEQEPEREEVQELVTEQEPEREEVQELVPAQMPIETPVRERSKTPINVVMLKSDKEKLQQAQAKEIVLPSWKDSKAPTNRYAVPSVKRTTEDSVKVEDEDSPTKVLEEELPLPSTIEANVIEEVQEKIEWQVYDETLQLLREPEFQQADVEWMEEQGQLLVEVLAEFNVPAEIENIVQGPTVTQFEITVGHGVKISKIKNLSDNLKLALAARDIRIEAPIPGKRSIGIEIPNAKARPVRLSEIVGNNSFRDSNKDLEVALGLDITGQPVTFDLSEMPHGLIAGATGSGKSVCINSILISLLMKASPQDVKLMLIDPKIVELAVYDELPHLVSPVITDVKAATAALKWAVDEMERRYQLFHHMKVRHITRYNEIVEEQRRFSLKMPYLVIVIDELADLMMMAPAEVEESICRIAQKARACGIHLVLATQRPSVDVITGLIKSNIPTRIAFSVSSQIDSRTIIDSQGAERLLGRGDLLYLGYGKSDTVRLQGTFVTDEEIEQITEYIRSLGKPNYAFAPEELVQKVEQAEEQDELFEEVCRSVAEEGSVSISSLQRKYRIGYNRAARLVEMMDAHGFVSEAKGTKPREVFLTPDQVDSIFQQ
ncbi:ftsK/SpoIIIE family protein [Kurthia sp. 11kri321]|uniref:DNA translocase FtsK n=1 Tax=Kurthia sp. 11kri321 TaxID=1750719 RepID=UPI000745CDF1|nr:DNA translocase FtsK [Kurthia sp. 11kri321]AMA63365.1 ftsK/SpoIIIE family protein [Kurthia sp. 11kri321]